jgi:pyruvate ferredoxin oxidoreductase delta subunit
MIDIDALKTKLGKAEVTLGGVLKSDGSSSRNKTGGWRAFRPNTNRDACTGCGLCWTVCPEGCIHKGADGKFSADLDYCKGCGICANECPVKAISMSKEEK